MSRPFAIALAFLLPLAAVSAQAAESSGPTAALAFDEQHRGDCCKPGALHCYPQARGISFSECAHIIPMSESLWTPGQLCADFQKRMQDLPPNQRKAGIIVLLKTERCATKLARACTITTAALEKRSTPLAADFLIYGVQIKPRDGDNPPGHLKIETGADAWKNEAAGEYRFEQGPGATLVFLNPASGRKLATTNAAALDLLEWDFVKDHGRTPRLHRMLAEVLEKIRVARASGASRTKAPGPA